MAIYSLETRSLAADMFERGLGRGAVSSSLGIPAEAVRNRQHTFRAVGREGLLDMGKKRSYDWETKVAAASAVVDSGGAKPEVMREFGIASASPLDSRCRKHREGGGYLPPHRASIVGKSAEVRHAAGVDKGMAPVLG